MSSVLSGCTERQEPDGVSGGNGWCCCPGIEFDIDEEAELCRGGVGACRRRASDLTLTSTFRRSKASVPFVESYRPFTGPSQVD